MNLAYVDQGYTGERAAKAAADHGITLEVVKLPEVKRGPHPEPVEGRPAATPMGGRARLRLDGALPPLGPRRRTPARHPRGIAPRRLQRLTAPKSGRLRCGP